MTKKKNNKTYVRNSAPKVFHIMHPFASLGVVFTSQENRNCMSADHTKLLLPQAIIVVEPLYMSISPSL